MKREEEQQTDDYHATNTLGATYCNALQCTATHCNALKLSVIVQQTHLVQRTAMHYNALQRTATH